MRVWVLGGLAFLIGGSLGLATTWLEFSGTPENMEISKGSVASVLPKANVASGVNSQEPVSTSAGRAVVVGDTVHDFGLLRPEASQYTTFVIKNEGQGNLHVEKDQVSCGLCVQTEFTQAIVKPGDEVVIPVTLTARKPGPDLNERLEVRTNDPEREHITFELNAYITKAVGASVTELAVGTLSTEEGGSASFRVYGFSESPLSIEKCDIRGSVAADFFQVEFVDLSPEALHEEQPRATSGKEVLITMKPGLPVGPLDQRVELVAQAGEEVSLRVPLNGRITGDISLVGGSKFSPEVNVLSLGRIQRGQGQTAKLHLMVKGEHREDVEVTVTHVDPEGILTATIGEAKAIQNGKTYMIPLTIEVPADAPSVNRLGGPQAELGKIQLRTTHPTTKEIALFVRFAVD